MQRRKIETFEDLVVWQKGIALVKQIYLLTAEGKLNRDFGLRDQLQRAAASIPTNIAEGFERSNRKDAKNIFIFSKSLKGRQERFEAFCRLRWKSDMLIRSVTGH